MISFSCRFGWHFYRSRCDCSCFSTNYKYGRDRTLGDRLDSSKEATWPASLFTFRHALKTFTRDEVVPFLCFPYSAFPYSASLLVTLTLSFLILQSHHCILSLLFLKLFNSQPPYLTKDQAQNRCISNF